MPNKDDSSNNVVKFPGTKQPNEAASESTDTSGSSSLPTEEGVEVWLNQIISFINENKSQIRCGFAFFVQDMEGDSSKERHHFIMTPVTPGDLALGIKHLEMLLFSMLNA